MSFRREWKCESCHEPMILNSANQKYCKHCKALNIKCKVCKRLFMSKWALQGHQGKVLH